jgi:hypothetical protein
VEKEVSQDQLVLKRYAPIGADLIRVTYGIVGSAIMRELRVPHATTWGETRWVEEAVAADLLRSHQAEEEVLRMSTRAPQRLGKSASVADIKAGNLSPRELALLRISGKDWKAAVEAAAKIEGGHPLNLLGFADLVNQVDAETLPELAQARTRLAAAAARRAEGDAPPQGAVAGQ